MAPTRLETGIPQLKHKKKKKKSKKKIPIRNDLVPQIVTNGHGLLEMRCDLF